MGSEPNQSAKSQFKILWLDFLTSLMVGVWPVPLFISGPLFLQNHCVISFKLMMHVFFKGRGISDCILFLHDASSLPSWNYRGFLDGKISSRKNVRTSQKAGTVCNECKNCTGRYFSWSCTCLLYDTELVFVHCSSWTCTVFHNVNVDIVHRSRCHRNVHLSKGTHTSSLKCRCVVFYNVMW